MRYCVSMQCLMPNITSVFLLIVNAQLFSKHSPTQTPQQLSGKLTFIKRDHQATQIVCSEAAIMICYEILKASSCGHGDFQYDILQGSAKPSSLEHRFDAGFLLITLHAKLVHVQPQLQPTVGTKTMIYTYLSGYKGDIL